MGDYIIAIDIGGSKILGAVMDRSAGVLMRRRENTCAVGHPGAVADQVARMVTQMKDTVGLQEQDILGIGVGVPGPLDYQAGVVEESPNLQWEKYPIRDELNKRLGAKLLLDKDTNVAVMGEAYFGVERPCDNMIYITVSTGIGGGIITEGRLLHGLHGGGGEIGHMAVDPDGPLCGCGRRGCLEAVASGTAIARQAEALIAQGGGKKILDYLEPGHTVSAREVAQAAHDGDEEALDLLLRAGRYLGAGIASLINILNPERVILGGGMALGAQDLLLPTIRNEAFNNIFSLHRRDLEIGMTRLGEDIVLAGCAAMVLHGPAVGNRDN